MCEFLNLGGCVATKALQEQRAVVVLHVVVSVAVLAGTGRHCCTVWKGSLQICAPENWSPPFIVRLRILGRQTVARPGYNPVPCLLFRSHPRDVFLVCALSNIELRMTLMCKSKNCFLPQ